MTKHPILPDPPELGPPIHLPCPKCNDQGGYRPNGLPLPQTGVASVRICDCPAGQAYERKRTEAKYD